MAEPWTPNFKPAKTTPEQRRADKRQRTPNPLKVVAGRKEGEQDSEVQADPDQHDRFKVDGSSLHSVSRKRLKSNKGRTVYNTFGFRDAQQRLRQGVKVRRSTKPWRNLSGRHDWSKTPKARAKLRQVGEKAKRWAAPLAAWRKAVHAVWGSCIITGEGRKEHLECHHMYDKAIRPRWRFETWNGIPLEKRTIHPLCDTYPEFHQALMAVADECKVAADGKRPPVTRTEAREIILRKAPKMRQYMRAEE